MLARRAGARLAYDAGMRPIDVALALGITPIAAARLQTRPVDAADLSAIRMRVALDLAAAARPAATPILAPQLVREPPAPPYELQDGPLSA